MKRSSNFKPSMLPSPRTQRRGAIVVCVMIVLLIVGMLTAQTMQATIVLHRGDAQRRQLRQARELVELGRLVVSQRFSGKTDSTDADREWEVAVDDSPPSTGRISLTVFDENPQKSPVKFRIVAEFPGGTERGVTERGVTERGVAERGVAERGVTVTWEDGR